jgi:exopolysaccharide production protein ExoQ
MIEMTTGLWVILILSILVGHAVLFVAARYFNIVALLVATFVMLAFLGFASTRGDPTPIRLARIYVAAVSLLLALRTISLSEIRGAGLLYLGFVILYVISSLWSIAPVDALARKTIYAMPMILGLLLGYAIRDRRDFDRSLRLLIIPGCAFALLFVLHIAGGPTHGRLRVLGTNPNQAGAFSAYMAIFCAYIALYSRAKIWRIIAYATGTVLAMAVLYTGSRGAAVVTILGCLTVFLPLARRPLAVVVLALVLLATGWFVEQQARTEASERMTETGLTGRDTLWSTGLSEIQDSPLFGVGWVPSADPGEGFAQSFNWHSTWIQVLVDSGLVGVTLLLGVVLVTAIYSLRTRRLLAGRSDLQPPFFLAGALFGSALAHGLVESAPVIGSSLASLLFPFSIVLLERLPIILGVEAPLTGEELLADQADVEAYAEAGYEYEEDVDGIGAVDEYPEGAY